MTIDEQFKLVDTIDDVICKCTKPYTLWITTLPYDCTGIYDPKIIETSNPIDGVMIHLLDDVDEQEIYIFINDEDKVKPIKNLLKPIDTLSRKASNIYFDITYYVLSDLYSALINAQKSSKNEANASIDVALPDDYNPTKRNYYYCGGCGDFYNYTKACAEKKDEN